MKIREFEQAVLKLAFESDAKITQASVAYYLGIPSQKASQLLDRLTEQGVLQLESDGEGHLYYDVPGSRDKQKGMGAEPPKQTQSGSSDSDEDLTDNNREETPIPARVGCEEGTEQKDKEPKPDEREYSGDTDSSSRLDRHTVSYLKARNAKTFEQDHVVTSRRPKEDAASESVTSSGHSVVIGEERINEPDTASAGSVKEEETNEQVSPVVEKGCRCEPRPLKDDRPVVASCEESTNESGPRTSGRSRKPSFSMENNQNQSNQSRESSSQVDHKFVPPEEARFNSLPFQQKKRQSHHPGMALLLSLVLCGTGQIYNGEISKGVMMMILCFLMWFVLLGWVVHIWAIIDSVVVAEKITKKGSSPQLTSSPG